MEHAMGHRWLGEELAEDRLDGSRSVMAHHEASNIERMCETTTV
jgi:hypothetical protein